MNMFRKIRGKHLYIVISFGIGIIFAIVGLCLKRNQTALSIYKIYENIYGELILIGFLIPIFLANTLKKEKEMERTMMILAFLSKQKWCKMMIRKMSKWSFFFTISIQWPLIFSNVFCNMISSKRIEKWEIIYAFLTWILSFIMFLTISLITMLNYNLRFWFAKLNSWESIWDKYKCYQLRF